MPALASDARIQGPMAQGVFDDAPEDELLLELLPLAISLISLIIVGILFLMFLFLRYHLGSGSLQLRDDGTLPTSVDEDDEFEDENAFLVAEQNWLAAVDPPTRAAYASSAAWQHQYPPNSLATDITLAQYMSIQEKGVSAWEFQPDYETNLPIMVHSRTEITFLESDSASTSAGCCVQSNLPIPRVNDVYYFEVKLFEKPQDTLVAVGLATKPYPTFRLPGWNKYSAAYFSSDGFKCHSYPFTAQPCGPPLTEGDTLGVGYRPATGTIFFTRNGRRLEDAFIGFNKFNVFPTIGANNACNLHVNLGQAGFVFIEANVKKWGLAPMVGTLAPPPPYGHESGSILLESSNANARRPQNADPPNASSPAPAASSHSASDSPYTPEPNASRSHRPVIHLSSQGNTDIRMDTLSSSESSPGPPEYQVMDPYKYAPGVAEVILQDMLGPNYDQTVSAPQGLENILSNNPRSFTHPRRRSRQPSIWSWLFD